MSVSETYTNEEPLPCVVAGGIAPVLSFKNCRGFRLPIRDNFTCKGDQTHVWRVNINPAQSRIAELAQTLAEDEREKAARFRQESDRRRFVIARGSLRMILSRYLMAEPTALRFYYGTHGKPALDESVADGLRFNVSHSGDLALVAITRDREVGIDVELVRDDFDVEAIADRYFSQRERALIRSSPASKKRQTFFTLWTLKEAYLKARGEGFFAPPNQVEVLPDAADPLTPDGTFLFRAGDRRWTHALIDVPGYAAALVVEGRCGEVECRQWTPEL